MVKRLIVLGILIIWLVSMLQIPVVNAVSDDYHDNLLKELAEDYDLPGGIFVIGDTEEETNSGFEITGDDAKDGRLQVISVKGQPFTQAVRVSSLKPGSQPWTINAKVYNVRPIQEGDVMLAVVYLRAVKASDESNHITTDFWMKSFPDFEPLGHEAFSVAVGKEWHRFFIPFVAKRSSVAGKAWFEAFLGTQAQTIDFGGVAVINYQRKAPVDSLPTNPFDITYLGRNPDAPWRKAAQKRIDDIRKGDLTVVVKDQNGRPLPSARVTVSMQKQAFAFGTAVNPMYLNNSGGDSDKYQTKLLQLFNQATIENSLKWNAWENPKDRAEALKGIEWLHDHGLKVRGHNLIWYWVHEWSLPENIREAVARKDTVYIREKIAAHIAEEAGYPELQGKLVDWDVINEPVNNRELVDLLGPEAMVEWFKLAHQGDPAVKLFINEYHTIESGTSLVRAEYITMIKYLLSQGAPLHGIGIQSHFEPSNLTPPETLWQYLNQYAALGLELQATEFDIGLGNYGDNPEALKLQADYTRDFYTVLFSHPAVTAITTWGFWEGNHWIPTAAFYRKDWTPKPSALVLENLLTKEWRTNETGKTDKDGVYKTRGFLGDYEITVSVGGKNAVVQKTVPATLTKAGNVITITLENPPGAEISASTPADGAVQVPVDTGTVTISFDREMDRSTLTPDNIILTGDDGQRVVYKEFSSTSTDYMMKLPGVLTNDSVYLVTVKNGVKDIHGIPMNERKLTLRTAEHFTVEKSAFSDADGNPVSTLVPDSLLQAKIQLKNHMPASSAVTMMLVVTEESGKVVKTAEVSGVVNSGEEAVFNAQILLPEAVEGLRVRVFLRDENPSGKYLTEEISFPESEEFVKTGQVDLLKEVVCS